MARYSEYKKKTFDLKKEAVAWAKDIKKRTGGTGLTIKYETNYRAKDGRWEAVVLQRVE